MPPLLPMMQPEVEALTPEADEEVETSRAAVAEIGENTDTESIENI